MENIWSLTDTNEFAIELMEHLCQKTRYGEELSVLSKAERIFYIAQTVEQEVNNGGFSQFFYNQSGNFSHEIADAFTAIGADTTAAICRKAVNAFGCDIPADTDERQAMLNEAETDEVDKILRTCDAAFFAYEEDLNELNHRFVLKNRESFS